MLAYRSSPDHTWMLEVIRQKQEPTFMSYAVFGVIGIFYLISMICLWKLWQKQVPIWSRVFWSMILLIPLLGPIFYGAWFRPPSVQPEDQRARERYY
jgi:hypothetical protein